MAAIPNSNIRTKINGEHADRVSIIEGANPFVPPKNTDAITAEYPSGAVEIYKYRTGGIGGAILKTVTITYVSSAKKDLLNVVVV